MVRLNLLVDATTCHPSIYRHDSQAVIVTPTLEAGTDAHGFRRLSWARIAVRQTSSGAWYRVAKVRSATRLTYN